MLSISLFSTLKLLLLISVNKVWYIFLDESDFRLQSIETIFSIDIVKFMKEMGLKYLFFEEGY